MDTPSAALTDILRSFNRKERFYLGRIDNSSGKEYSAREAL